MFKVMGGGAWTPAMFKVMEGARSVPNDIRHILKK